MIVKPPKFKSKNMIPQPKHKNYDRYPEIENKENIINKRTKCDSYQRHFGKEITNTISNPQNILKKKHSFSNRKGKETQKVK